MGKIETGSYIKSENEGLNLKIKQLFEDIENDKLDIIEGMSLINNLQNKVFNNLIKIKNLALKKAENGIGDNKGMFGKLIKYNKG